MNNIRVNTNSNPDEGEESWYVNEYSMVCLALLKDFGHCGLQKAYNVNECHDKFVLVDGTKVGQRKTAQKCNTCASKIFQPIPWLSIFKHTIFVQKLRRIYYLTYDVHLL